MIRHPSPGAVRNRRWSRRVKGVRLRTAIAALVLTLPFAGGRTRGANAAEPAGAAAGWDYEIATDAASTRITVRLCLRDFAPKRIVLDPDAAWAAVKWLPGGAGGVTLERDERGAGGYVVTNSGGNECLEYEVDVAAMLEAARDMGTGRWGGTVGGDVVLRVPALLARPAMIPDGWRGRATFRLPEGVKVSAPWARTGPTAFDLDGTVYAYDGHVALGTFDALAVDAAGARFDVAILEGKRAATDAGIARWIAKAAETAGLLYGGFPQPRAQIVVRPGRSSSEEVIFGSAWRGGGPAVLLDLAGNAADASLPGEWVAIHEMGHLGQPVMSGDDAWFYEGITTYYQEVLRCRAGWQTPEEAWAEMEDGFAAGRRSKDEMTIAEASRRMRETHQYRRVYWAGVVVALEADLALRASKEGPARSLDDVMRWIRRTLDDLPGVRTAAEILAGADRWIGRPLLEPIASRVLASADFPDVSADRRFLGFEVGEGGRVTRRADAPGAALVSAIFGRVSPPAASTPPGASSPPAR